MSKDTIDSPSVMVTALVTLHHLQSSCHGYWTCHPIQQWEGIHKSGVVQFLVNHTYLLRSNMWRSLLFILFIFNQSNLSADLGQTVCRDSYWHVRFVPPGGNKNNPFLFCSAVDLTNTAVPYDQPPARSHIKVIGPTPLFTHSLLEGKIVTQDWHLILSYFLHINCDRQAT